MIFAEKIQWTFKHDKITIPHGVTVDTYGNVFDADNAYSVVVVISPEGQQHKQLLSPEDCVHTPNSLVIYDRHNNHLLVTNYAAGVFLHNVTHVRKV